MNLGGTSIPSNSKKMSGKEGALLWPSPSKAASQGASGPGTQKDQRWGWVAHSGKVAPALRCGFLQGSTSHTFFAVDASLW